MVEIGLVVRWFGGFSPLSFSFFLFSQVVIVSKRTYNPRYDCWPACIIPSMDIRFNEAEIQIQCNNWWTMWDVDYRFSFLFFFKPLGNQLTQIFAYNRRSAYWTVRPLAEYYWLWVKNCLSLDFLRFSYFSSISTWRWFCYRFILVMNHKFWYREWSPKK